MNIKTISVYPNFGRAFTTNEKQSYKKLINDTKKELGIKDTSAIVFDFNVPSEKGKNTAIGTTWSDSMKKFTSFLQNMTGINSIQLEPQGKITEGNNSPYSGTNFAFGTHIIDLEKLTTKEYANLLSKSEIKNLDIYYEGDKLKREYKTDYNYVFNIQRKTLHNAFQKYQSNLINNDQNAINMSIQFEKFKTENKNWLEKECLFQALTKKYGNDDFNQWEEIDKNLYSCNITKEQRDKRIEQLKKEYANDIEFESFMQFIADKQQKESREYLNNNNIKLYGDCLIGFSQSEIWANKDCFRENLYYGGPDFNCPETNNIQTWGLRALDYSLLGTCDKNGDLSQLGKTGKFLYEKYSAFFKRYDGVRLDAAWQLVTPFIYQNVKGTYEEVKFPEIDYTILNIMHAAAKNTLGDKFNENNPENIMLELIGMSADKSRAMTKNKYPHLYTTAYAEYDERPVKFIEKGYQNDKFYTGVGSHDNNSLVNMAKYKKRSQHMQDIKNDFNINESIFDFKNQEFINSNDEIKFQERYRTAKFAEIFTSAKQFFTLPDMFGMSERINISGKSHPDNWSVRIPSDYERFYFSQLSKGYGLNMPKTLSSALKMKHSNNNRLIEKCDEAAEILRSEGPLTENEANLAQQKGILKDIFKY